MRIDCPRCGNPILWKGGELPPGGMEARCGSCGRSLKVVPQAAWTPRRRAPPLVAEPAPGPADPAPAPGLVTPGPAGSFRFAPPSRARVLQPAPSIPHEQASLPPQRHQAPAPGWQAWFLAGLGAVLVVVGLGVVGAVLASGATLSGTERAYAARVAAWAMEEERPAGDARRWLEEGREALEEGTAEALGRARTAYRRALILDRELLAAATGWLEAAALEDGALDHPARRQTALDLANHLLAEAPQDPAVHRAWSLALSAMGDGAAAIRHAETSIHLAGRRPEALAALARAHLAAGDSVAALAVAGELADADPGSPLGPYLRGRALEQLGERQGAEAAYLLALERKIAYLPAQRRIEALDARRGEAEASTHEALLRDRRGRDALEASIE